MGFVLIGNYPLPKGVVDCGFSVNRQNCEPNCVGSGWYSSQDVIYEHAGNICKSQGYKGEVIENYEKKDAMCHLPSGLDYTPIFEMPHGQKAQSGPATWNCAHEIGTQYYYTENVAVFYIYKYRL